MPNTLRENNNHRPYHIVNRQVALRISRDSVEFRLQTRIVASTVIARKFRPLACRAHSRQYAWRTREPATAIVRYCGRLHSHIARTFVWACEVRHNGRCAAHKLMAIYLCTTSPPPAAHWSLRVVIQTQIGSFGESNSENVDGTFDRIELIDVQ